MSSVDQWSTDPDANNLIAKDGMPEQMDRSAVNNQSRAQMASLRTFFGDGEWLDPLQENAGSFTLLKNDATNFWVVDATGTNATSRFPIHSWLRITGTVPASEPTVVIARVSAVGAHGSAKILVTVDTILNGVASPPTLAAEVTIPVSSVTKVEHYWNNLVDEAAFHPVGTTVGATPAQLLTVDNVSHADTITQLNTASGLDADLLEGNAASAFQLVSAESTRNAVANGSMNIWQRGTSISKAGPGTTGNTGLFSGDYTADTWIHLADEKVGGGPSDTDNWDVSRESTTVPPGCLYSMKLTSNSLGDKKVGILHVLTAPDSAAMVSNGKASLSYSVFLPNGSIQTLRAAVVEWTGTADAAAKVMVTNGNWGNETTDPGSLATGWAYSNTPVDDEVVISAGRVGGSALTGGDVDAVDVWIRREIPNIPIGASTKNIGVFIYSMDVTFSASNAFFVGAVQLEVGTSCTPFVAGNYSMDMERCRSRFQTTYNYGVQPGTATQAGGSLTFVECNGFFDLAATEALANWRFNPGLYSDGTKTPTISIYAPTSGASDKSDDSTGGDLSTVAIHTGTNGTVLQITGNPGDGAFCKVHATASSDPTDVA